MGAVIAGFLPVSLADFLTGGIITGAIAIIGLWWKIRKEKADNLLEARKVAVEEAASKMEHAEKSVKIMGSVVEELRKNMTEQSQRITDMGTAQADLSNRLTNLSQRHGVAIRHIVEREWWTATNHPDRPMTLPPIPEVLLQDIQQADPKLIIVRHEQGD